MDNPMAINGPTYGLDVSTSSASITLSDDLVNTTRVIVVNPTAVSVFVVAGKTSAPTAAFPATTAKAAGKVIPAGSTQVFTKATDDKYFAAITPSGSGTIYFSFGSGT